MMSPCGHFPGFNILRLVTKNSDIWMLLNIRIAQSFCIFYTVYVNRLIIDDWITEAKTWLKYIVKLGYHNFSIKYAKPVFPCLDLRFQVIFFSHIFSGTIPHVLKLQIHVIFTELGSITLLDIYICILYYSLGPGKLLWEIGNWSLFVFRFFLLFRRFLWLTLLCLREHNA